VLQQTQLPTAEEIDRALREVYARPEFRPRPEGSFWDIILKPIGRLLRWLGEKLSGFRGLEDTAPWVYYLIVAWLALTALAIIGHLVFTAISAMPERRRQRLEAPDAAPRRGPRTAQDWEAEARRAAAAGNLREAALALYQAVLLRLDSRGAVRFDPSKTPGDYRREVRRHPELATPFGSFLRGFEPVAFGGRALDPAGYERLRSAAGEAGAHG
jgi:hypothetical protein